MAEQLTLIRVVDVETTGLDEPAEMVEIGWTDVRLFPAGWAIESGPHSLLVRPGLPITFPAMAIHHITDDMVFYAQRADDVRADIAAGADIFCAHNAMFDRRFVRTALPWICTFKAAKTAWPEMQSHGNGSLRYERGLCLGDPRTQPAHRAGPDTWITAHILLDLLKIYQAETLIELSAKPVLLLKINFGKHEGQRFSDLPWDYLDWIVNKSGMKDDATKEDVVHTARIELQKRAGAEARAPAIPTGSAWQPEDPDAWRKEMERF